MSKMTVKHKREGMAKKLLLTMCRQNENGIRKWTIGFLPCSFIKEISRE